jgi:hypothetical protein
MTADQPTDERVLAGAVREYSTRHHRQRRLDRDRTDVARVLHAQGMANWQIAEILAVDWPTIDAILTGEAAR